MRASVEQSDGRAHAPFQGRTNRTRQSALFTFSPISIPSDFPTDAPHVTVPLPENTDRRHWNRTTMNGGGRVVYDAEMGVLQHNVHYQVGE